MIRHGFRARLAASDRIDVDKARAFSEAHAQAQARVDPMHAMLDAKVRALLTREQRRQLDDERANTESRRHLKRSYGCD